jgi:hypothetical protein
MIYKLITCCHKKKESFQVILEYDHYHWDGQKEHESLLG